MNISELKRIIIEQSSVYMTTEEQKAKIMEGQEQIAKGNFFTNEQVEEEIDEWLNKEKSGRSC